MTRSIPRAALVLLATVVAAACSDYPVSPAARSVPTDASAGNSSPGSLPTVSLTVTVSDADNALTPYRIRSDGQGLYVDGSQNVQAILDQYGTFAFNTRATRSAAIRFVNYDFNAPVDPSNTYRPTPSSTQNYHFSTGPSAFSPFTPLQNLGVGQTECIYMGNGIANATTSWRVSFHKGLENVSDTPTAFAVVTRTSATDWIVTPAGTCSKNSNVAALRSGDGTVLYGYYNLPFFFTLHAR